MSRYSRYVIVMLAMTLLVIVTVSAGEILGDVTELSTGQPISGLDMNLYDLDWNFIDINAQTSGGQYHFYDVPAGDYYVRANPQYPFHYQHQYWQNSPDQANATAISVPETGSVTGIDFSLDDGWYIEGKVSDINGGVLTGIDINVYDLNWLKQDVDTETDEYGRYKIGGLPEGQYYVMANPVYMQPYVDQFFDHSAGPNHAVPVTLTAPDDLVGISFTLLDGSYIRGRVTDRDTGDPLVGFWVKGYNEYGNKMRLEGQTDSDGNFTIGAYVPGDYYVKVDPSYPDGYMDTYYPEAFCLSDAQKVTVTVPKPTNNVNITVPAGSYIRGDVLTENQTALENIKVKFYDRDWNYMEMATTVSNSSGSYISGALKPGKYYAKAVPVYPQPWIDEYYPSGVETGDADDISVALAGETTGIDFSLQPGGYVLGTISDDTTGNPIDDVDLDIYDGQWNWVDYSDHSNVSGRYLIGALPYGQYYLRADPSLALGYVPQFYHLAFMADDATVITLDSSQNQENLDFSLNHGGFISGTVRDADTGLPVDSIELELLDINEVIQPVHTIKTNTSGEYTAHGIPGGEYYVLAAGADDDGYEMQYYNNVPSIAAAQTVTVTVGNTTTDIDFSLTSVPVATPTPAVSLGVDLEMPLDMYEKNDIFYLNVRVSNPGQPVDDVPLFVLLDAFGALYFWPSWVSSDTGYDFQLIRLETGIQIIPILPAFEWPDVSGSADGILFYGGMTRPDFSRLLGDMDVVSFGYR